MNESECIKLFQINVLFILLSQMKLNFCDEITLFVVIEKSKIKNKYIRTERTIEIVSRQTSEENKNKTKV